MARGGSELGKGEKSAVGFLLLTGKRWGAENRFATCLAPSRGEFDFDLGTEGAGGRKH
jgi:hypothetical protein